ncbi:MAG: pentapeptide repeat-containing protein [Acidimicrobiales bacterium]
MRIARRAVLAPRLPAVLGDERGDLRLVPGTEWTSQEVRGDFTGQVGDGLELSQCRVIGATLTATRLDRARIVDTVFENCDLSGAALGEASLTRVAFADCRMLGVITPQAVLRDVRFTDCRMDGASLRMVVGERVMFEHCELTGADFYAARLAQACLFDCNLVGAELSQANFEGARLHGSTLQGLKGGASLQGVTIESTQVLAVAMQVLAGLGITIDDERDPRPDEPAAGR